MSDKYIQNVITLKRIKNVATDIKNDFYEGNDSHSRAEYKGACESLDMLTKHFEEVTANQQDELTIDINQYIQEDNEYGDVRIWFNTTKFVDDAVEYLENDNVGSEIIRE